MTRNDSSTGHSTPPLPPPGASSLTGWGALSAIWSRLPGLWMFPVVLFIAAVGDGAVNEGPVICPFNRLFDLPCPGCGFTRSFVALAHGRLHQAFDVNPLGPLLLTWMIGWWVYACGSLWRGHWPRPTPQWAWWTAAALLLTFGVGRLVWLTVA